MERIAGDPVHHHVHRLPCKIEPATPVIFSSATSDHSAAPPSMQVDGRSTRRLVEAGGKNSTRKGKPSRAHPSHWRGAQPPPATPTPSTADCAIPKPSRSSDRMAATGGAAISKATGDRSPSGKSVWQNAPFHGTRSETCETRMSVRQANLQRNRAGFENKHVQSSCVGLHKCR